MFVAKDKKNQFPSCKSFRHLIMSQSGFTLTEIIVVLSIIGLLTLAMVSGVGVDNSELTTVELGLKSHIRFAQLKAMQSTSTVWGIRINANSNRYWLFNCPVDTNCRYSTNRIIPPGGQGGEMDVNSDRLDTDLMNVDIDRIRVGAGSINRLTLVFDQYGVPYYHNNQALTFRDPLSDTSNLTMLASDIRISLTDSNENQTEITVSTETGFVQ